MISHFDIYNNVFYALSEISTKVLLPHLLWERSSRKRPFVHLSWWHYVFLLLLRSLLLLLVTVCVRSSETLACKTKIILSLSVLSLTTITCLCIWHITTAVASMLCTAHCAQSCSFFFLFLDLWNCINQAIFKNWREQVRCCVWHLLWRISRL